MESRDVGYNINTLNELNEIQAQNFESLRTEIKDKCPIKKHNSFSKLSQ